MSTAIPQQSSYWEKAPINSAYDPRDVPAKASTSLLYRSKQQSDFNKRHRKRQLKPLKTGDQVWIPELYQQATVLHEVAARPYLIQTPRGRIRRNWQQLTFLDTTESTFPRPATVILTSSNDSPHHKSPPPGATTTRSGCMSRPPNRLNSLGRDM